MNEVVTQTYSGVFSSTALSVGRDLVSGYWGDYAFFRVAEDQYIMVMSYSFDEQSMTAYDATVYTLTHIPRDFEYNVPENYVYSVDVVDTYTIQNTSILMYSSFSGYPHLQSGGELNALLLAGLLFSMCIFRLVRGLLRVIC